MLVEDALNERGHVLSGVEPLRLCNGAEQRDGHRTREQDDCLQHRGQMRIGCAPGARAEGEESHQGEEDGKRERDLDNDRRGTHASRDLARAEQVLLHGLPRVAELVARHFGEVDAAALPLLCQGRRCEDR